MHFYPIRTKIFFLSYLLTHFSPLYESIKYIHHFVIFENIGYVINDLNLNSTRIIWDDDDDAFVSDLFLHHFLVSFKKKIFKFRDKENTAHVYFHPLIIDKDDKQTI